MPARTIRTSGWFRNCPPADGGDPAALTQEEDLGAEVDRCAVAALSQEDLDRGESIVAEVVKAVEECAVARSHGIPILSQESFLRRRRMRAERPEWPGDDLPRG